MLISKAALEELNHLLDPQREKGADSEAVEETRPKAKKEAKPKAEKKEAKPKAEKAEKAEEPIVKEDSSVAKAEAKLETEAAE